MYALYTHAQARSTLKEKLYYIVYVSYLQRLDAKKKLQKVSSEALDSQLAYFYFETLKRSLRIGLTFAYTRIGSL